MLGHGAYLFLIRRGVAKAAKSSRKWQELHPSATRAQLALGPGGDGGRWSGPTAAC